MSFIHKFKIANMLHSLTETVSNGWDVIKKEPEVGDTLK